MYLKQNGVIILADRLKVKQIIEKFSNVKSFSRKELKAFYEKYNSELKENTFRWMIYDLKKKKIIASIDRGVYSLVNQTYSNSNPMLGKEKYKPSVSKNLGKLYKGLKKQFPFLGICVWETSWLNEFMLHQPGRFFSIVEVEKGFEETVFNYLRKNYSDVFIQPTRRELELYIYSSGSSIVVKNLITQSPLSNNSAVIIPKLEKILIDVFTEKDFFYPYQGQELFNIYNNAFHYYQISLKTLFRYAGRRKCKELLEEYLQKIHFN